MYNKKYVIPLILVFLIGFFTPYWYNAMAGTIGHIPEMKKLPETALRTRTGWLQTTCFCFSSGELRL